MCRQQTRRTIRFLAPGAMVALAAAGLAGLSMARAAQEATPASPLNGRQLEVIERLTNVKVVDLGESGDSMGDLLVLDNPIYDAADTTQIGTAQGSCVRVDPGVAWECAWTVILDDGQLSMAGPFLDAADASQAVTGGTGAFAGVSGQMTYHARNAEGSAYELVFDLQ
jgi:allene oxide cyclase